MNKDVIIFVNAIRPQTFEALREYERQSGRRFEPIVLVDEKIKKSIFEYNGQNDLPEKVTVVTADFDSAASVRLALRPYEERIFAVTSQFENCVQELRQLLPYLPYVPTPTETSLVWATEKKLMRKMMEAYNPSLVPGYMEVADAEQATIENIESTISYPMIVKPSGLESSLLVSYVNNRQELTTTLANTFLSIQASYDSCVKRQKPAVLVEDFMVGDMYTMDVYVGARGECFFTPIVRAIVARDIGFDDFFGYKVSLPSDLDKSEEEKGQQAASAACHALGLRSSTAHVEMMLTQSGWKIIELGPRTGGYRHDLLQQAYGINHIMNDIRIRAGEVPDIPLQLHKYVATFNIYARSEGVLKAIYGFEETRKLSSFVFLHQSIFIGQPVLFAKNGGEMIADITLSNTDKAQLEADIATMEAAITFDVEPEA